RSSIGSVGRSRLSRYAANVAWSWWTRNRTPIVSSPSVTGTYVHRISSGVNDAVGSRSWMPSVEATSDGGTSAHQAPAPVVEGARVGSTVDGAPSSNGASVVCIAPSAASDIGAGVHA